MNIQQDMQLPGYQFNKKIADGGMASVYKGVQLSLDRPVAIKMLNQQMQKHSEALAHFEAESVIIARLNHPNIIHVIDRGVSSEGTPYFIMEYVDGADLKTVLKKTKISFLRKVEICSQICKALSYAHKNGVVHRDIKPANVLIDHEANARVLDFGIALLRDDNTGVREKSDIVGTLSYVSPEQKDNALAVTNLSDIYSMGVMMYEMFVGRVPKGRFKSPREIVPKLPKALDKLIMRCLQHDPEKRPKSADKLHKTLLKVMQGSHLNEEQKQRANDSIENKHSFALLDVLKEEPDGSVYLMEERSTHSPIIIKKRTQSDDGYAENRRLAVFKHPNIVKILGVSKNKRSFIIVMEYLSGGSLEDRLLQPYNFDDFMRLASDICAALNFAHQNKIIHGNITPKNIFFDEDDTVKICDFGMVETGRTEGYEIYVPESEAKGVAADIFACGVIFYQMLTCTIPQWKGTSIRRSSSFNSLPAQLQTVLMKMLDKDAARRYKSIKLVMSQLDEISEEMPTIVKQGSIEEKEEEVEEVVREKEKRSLTPVYVTVAVLANVGLFYLLSTIGMSDAIAYLKGIFITAKN